MPLLVLLFAVATVNISFASAELRVGVASVDITPPVGFRKAGSYKESISTAVRDPLFAKAIVFAQEDVSAAVVICDLLSVPWELSQGIRNRASQSTGIPASNIVVAATHNHGSPEYWGALRNVYHRQEVEKRGHDVHESINYQSRLVDHCVHAVTRACRQATPATLSTFVAHQRGLAFNRRFHMQDGTVRFNPGRRNPNIVRPAGPTDVDLPILFIRELENSDRIRGCLSSFALHTAVRSGTEFSDDFPAVLQSRLQDSFGRRFVSLFAQGAAGDINHVDVTVENASTTDEMADLIGGTLVNTIVAADAKAVTISSPSLAVASATFHAPFQSIDEAGYQHAMSVIKNQAIKRTAFLAVVAAWRDCHRYQHSQAYGNEKPMEVQAIRCRRAIKFHLVANSDRVPRATNGLENQSDRKRHSSAHSLCHREGQRIRFVASTARTIVSVYGRTRTPQRLTSQHRTTSRRTGRSYQCAPEHRASCGPHVEHS